MFLFFILFNLPSHGRLKAQLDAQIDAFLAVRSSSIKCQKYEPCLATKKMSVQYGRGIPVIVFYWY
jgi:hypothetical protein